MPGAAVGSWGERFGRGESQTEMALPTIHLPRELGRRLQQGHPWVYRDRLQTDPNLASGTWVRVRCGEFEGFGLWDARSPIAVRVFSRTSVPDAAWVAERIRQAWQMREPLRREGTSAYRWLYGEGDGVPGVVVDLYNDYAVVEVYADALHALLDWVRVGLLACTKLKGIVLRGEGVTSLWGRQPNQELVVEENGLRLYVDLVAGQKTGLYLDQRENRQYVEPWCAGKRVLNCFAYTGAFSLYAIRGGAIEVTGVDIASPLAYEYAHNLELNGFDPDAHSFVVADCFELLQEYAERGAQYDLVIVDPPSLARAKKSRFAAQRAYVHLNQAAMRCVAPGGSLATASCTSQVSPQAFREALGEAAARAERRFLMLHEAGQAIDHPVPAHFPEGRYLKFVLGQVMEAV
jgi:23S rRNA (cytosine1962-C5)-methyltransferase